MNKQSQEVNSKQISKIEKEIEQLTNFKVRSSDIQTLEELKEAEKQNRITKIIKIIDLYLFDKKVGLKPMLKNYAVILKMHPETFSKYVKHWEEFEELPTHKNTNKTPWNKLEAQIVNKYINEVNKILLRNELFTKEEVPMSITVLYFFIKKTLIKEGKYFDISRATFYRIINADVEQLISKFSWKIRRKIKRKILRLRTKLEELKKKIVKTTIILNNSAIQAQILADKSTPKAQGSKNKVSPRRTQFAPGECIQIDGSQDQFYNGKKITRIHIIEHSSLVTCALEFVKNENNKGIQGALSQIIDFWIPSVMYCDRRKGVDPADDGALIAIICHLLDIQIVALSDSTHKAELESLNGKMHPLITTMAATNNWKTIDQMNENKEEIKNTTNEFFNKKPASFKHLRQATEEQKIFLKGDIQQIRIKSMDGIIHNKKAYQAIGPEGVVELDRLTWGLILLEKGLPVSIWTKTGIFKLKEITKKIGLEIFAENATYESGQKHFIDNGVMIINLETFDFITKTSREQGFKDAIQHKLYMLDEQIKEKIKRKRELD